MPTHPWHWAQPCARMQDEAFALWTSEWGALYEEGSHSRQIIDEIASTWYLVSVVDNDYVHGELFSVLNTAESKGSTAAA